MTAEVRMFPRPARKRNRRHPRGPRAQVVGFPRTVDAADDERR